MIKINLLPVRASKKKETAKQQGIIFAASLITFLAIIAALYSTQLVKIASAKTRIETSEKEVERLKSVVGEIDNIKMLQQAVKKKLDVLDRLRQEKAGPAIRLARLSEATPEKLWLTRYAESGATVSISGIAFNEDILAEFLRKLQSSKEFSNVELLVSEQVELSAVKAKRFDITCALSFSKKEDPAAQAIK